MYDKSKIMKTAWEICRIRKCDFGFALSTAWLYAKQDLGVSEPFSKTQLKVVAIESKERLTTKDYADIRKLERAAA